MARARSLSRARRSCSRLLCRWRWFSRSTAAGRAERRDDDATFSCRTEKAAAAFQGPIPALAAGLIAPTVILLVFALTFGDFTSLKLAWVDEDGSTYSAQLEESIFSQISPLGDRPYFEAVVAEREEAQALYDAGKVNGIVACSEGFGAALARGENGVIDYSFNNYNTDMAKNLRLYLEEGILVSTAPPTAICSLRCAR